MEKLYLSQSTHISSAEMLATETNVFHSLAKTYTRTHTRTQAAWEGKGKRERLLIPWLTSNSSICKLTHWCICLIPHLLRVCLCACARGCFRARLHYISALRNPLKDRSLSRSGSTKPWSAGLTSNKRSRSSKFSCSFFLFCVLN